MFDGLADNLSVGQADDGNLNVITAIGVKGHVDVRSGDTASVFAFGVASSRETEGLSFGRNEDGFVLHASCPSRVSLK